MANLDLGLTCHLARQYDQALAQGLRTIELDPNDPRAYGHLANAYVDLRPYGEATKAHQEAMSLSGAKPEDIAALGEAYRLSGYRGYLHWRLQRPVHPYEAALIQAQLGLKDEAFANLEKCYQEHWWAMVQLKNNRTWDPLRSDPRFQELLRRMNLPP